MQRVNTQLVHSASDIVGALECRHLAHLERAAVDGHLQETDARGSPCSTG